MDLLLGETSATHIGQPPWAARCKAVEKLQVFSHPISLTLSPLTLALQVCSRALYANHAPACMAGHVPLLSKRTAELQYANHTPECMAGHLPLLSSCQV